MNVRAAPLLAQARPSALEPARGTRPPNLRLHCRGDRRAAPERRTGGRRCGYRAAESTRKSVHPTGEGDRRSGRTGIRRCGYLAPTSTRLAVDFNGERRHPVESRADRGVDIRPPTRLETLCDRPVSARPLRRRPRRCGHPAFTTNPNAVHPMGEHAPFGARKPLPRGPRTLAATPGVCLPHIRAFSRQRLRPVRYASKSHPPRRAKTLSISDQNLRGFSHSEPARAR